MEALASECEKAGVSFVNIALAGNRKADPWIIENNQLKFNNITLFPDNFSVEIPAKIGWPKLKEKLQELAPDVIFVIGYDQEIMRRVKFWADRNRIATVLVSDSNEFDMKRYKILQFAKSSLVSRFDAAFVAGTSSRSYIQKLGIPMDRIIEGCDVIDTTLFSQQASENRNILSQVRNKWKLPENYFLFVGRIVTEKNVLGLVDAYDKYLSRIEPGFIPWDLVICGSGSEESDLLEKILKFPAHVREKIFFYGYIKQPEIIDFFSCASCFILPSISEPWGLVVNEALACSLPVIISKKAGSSFDLVKEKGTGWIFNPDDIDELMNLMLDITKMKVSTRFEMGDRGLNLISEWDLVKFSQGALKCAQIAFLHQEKMNQIKGKIKQYARPL
jgi:glycosyltransferase involved in cell wall biosynthesis